MHMTEHLTLSVPVRWTEALATNNPGCLEEVDRVAYRRWKKDLEINFGSFHLHTVEAGTFFDSAHEGTEFGAKPARCRNAVLRFDA